MFISDLLSTLPRAALLVEITSTKLPSLPVISTPLPLLTIFHRCASYAEVYPFLTFSHSDAHLSIADSGDTYRPVSNLCSFLTYFQPCLELRCLLRLPQPSYPHSLLFQPLFLSSPFSTVAHLTQRFILS